MNLLFHQAALGDFVLTLPLLRGLGPTTVIAPWSKAALAARLVPGTQPMDIELFEFTRLHAEGGPSAVSPAVREMFEAADVILSFVAAADSPWPDNVQRLAPQAQIAMVSPRPAEEWRRHVTAWHAAQLADAGIALDPVPAQPRAGSSGPIVIHPGSGGKAKCWARSRFEQLIAALREAGHAVRPVLGEAELERWDDATLSHWQDKLGAVGCVTLDALADELDKAGAYIGNDAGPTHLAAQMGLPTLALFGPTDPLQWLPVGPAVQVLAPPEPTDMTWLPVADVLAAAEQLVPRP